jgi:hypothetical protein
VRTRPLRVRRVLARCRSAGLAAAAFPLVAGLSCSLSETAPTAYEPAPLLVTNGTCVDGNCDSLRVLGFPINQPLTPGGLWSLDLGVVTTEQACLTIPTSAVFLVIAVHGDGARDTTDYPWTPALGIALGAQPPSESRLWASPSTATFVPAEATGWSVTVPSDSTVVPAPPCTAVAAHRVRGGGL